jgi:hypothetical protein
MVLLASDYDRSKYLKASDIDRDTKYRIKKVTEELIGTGLDKEKKLVVWFTNDTRGLPLNKTNNRTLRGAFGDPVDGWTGKIIVVFPTMVDVRGKMGPALRVRIPPPKQQPAAAPPSPQPAPSGNGATAAKSEALSIDDPDLAPDPVKSLTDELDDEIGF